MGRGSTNKRLLALVEAPPLVLDARWQQAFLTTLKPTLRALGLSQFESWIGTPRYLVVKYSGGDRARYYITDSMLDVLQKMLPALGTHEIYRAFAYEGSANAFINVPIEATLRVVAPSAKRVLSKAERNMCIERAEDAQGLIRGNSSGFGEGRRFMATTELPNGTLYATSFKTLNHTRFFLTEIVRSNIRFQAFYDFNRSDTPVPTQRGLQLSRKAISPVGEKLFPTRHVRLLAPVS